MYVVCAQRQNSKSLEMAVRAKRSEILKYFTEKGDHTVKCQICQAKLSYQSTTSTMRQHMLLKHNGEFGKADPQQPSVSAIFTAARRFCNPGRVEKIAEYFHSPFAAVLFGALNYLRWLGYLFRFCFF